MENSYQEMAEKYFDEYKALLDAIFHLSVGRKRLAHQALEVYLTQLNPTDWPTRHRFYRRFINFKTRIRKQKKRQV